MATLGKFLQTGDWKGEKHVPVIHAPEKVKAGEGFELKISIGDAIKHPNTLEHHIAWFKVFYVEEGGKFPVELVTFNFSAHGEFGAFTEPEGTALVKLNKSGKIYAVSYCNIHGLWENAADIVVE
ncbi:MAG: class II SORL domain-containing protein [Caldicoprobacterales bacterium]|jgi:superoxide reductase|nr:superoxide reductase [Clostridiales bacterium]